MSNYQNVGSHFKKMDDENDDDDDESKERENLVANVAIMMVSMLLIGLVTIAIMVNLESSKDAVLNKRTLLSICEKTHEPGDCLRVLKHAGENATVLDYVRAGINSTLTELLVVNIPKPYLMKNLPPLQKQSYLDCLELLTLAKEELVSLYMMANPSVLDISFINQDDVINHLSAVISYQQTCSNELMRTNSYEILGYSLKIPMLLTRITLAIVKNFSKLPDRNGSTPRDLSERLPQVEKKIMEVQRYGGSDQEPNIVVAQDGSGQFSTITQSINECAKSNKSSCVIYVKKGKYQERVTVPKNLEKVIMYGDGPLNTIVTGINTSDPEVAKTFLRAATFVVMGKGFICKNMGFIAPVNITGAPALLVLSDHAVFFNCKIVGEEGSLYAMAQRQFYRECEIHGSVDILKGDSTTIIQNSLIIVKPRNSSDLVLRSNVVSSQYRSDENEGTGFVIQNCTITTSQGENSKSSLVDSTCLGTPRNEYSRTIIMESFLGDVIHPKGWCEWSDNYGIDTATFVEYNNRGPRAETQNRVHWGSYKTISKSNQITNFTAAQFIQAKHWLQNANISYEAGFIFNKTDS